MKKKLYFILVLSVFFTCAKNEQNVITHAVKKSSYTISVSGQGQLEAKNSRKVVVPQIWGRPEIAYLIEEGTRVQKGDVVARFEASDMKNNYMNLLDELSIARANAQQKESELKLQMLMYTSQLHTAEASAKAARLQLEKLEFEPANVQEKKRLEIKQYELEAERARKKLQALDEIQKEERAHLEAQIKQVQSRLDRIKSMLDRLTVRTPIEGIVVYEINWRTDEKVKEGDALRDGWPFLSIPDLSVMQVDVQIDENKAQKLWAGQKARIRVPSIGEKPFPGHVTKVDRVAKSINRGSKVKMVNVKVEIDTAHDALKPGLSAECEIIIKELQDVLAVPKEALFTRDSVNIVYARKSQNFSIIPVVVLLQDEDFSIIHGDLKDNAQLALQQPPRSAISVPDKLVQIKQPAWADTLKIEKPIKDSTENVKSSRPGDQFGPPPMPEQSDWTDIPETERPVSDSEKEGSPRRGDQFRRRQMSGKPGKSDTLQLEKPELDSTDTAEQPPRFDESFERPPMQGQGRRNN